MTTRETIMRYHLIINRLRKSPATLAEIASFLQDQSDLQGYNFNTSARTFKRDCEDIAAIYGIDIVYNFSRKAYNIECEESDEGKHRIMEAFDLIDTLGINKKIASKVCFEKRHPQGTENMYGLLHAINTHVRISFTHQKYWDDELSVRTVKPYALKEFRNRWYLLAKDLKDNRIKTFGLDRISKLEVSSSPFTNPHYDVDEHFKYCFGIINGESTQVQEVILSFTPQQGKYIKSLPLHDSQEVLIDNEDETRIRLKLYLSFDFEQELLSLGNRVKVVSPESLAQRIREAGESIAAQYD